MAAPHQLAAAIDALALVVRPMLVHGLPVDDEGAPALDPDEDESDADGGGGGGGGAGGGGDGDGKPSPPLLPALVPDAGAAFVRDAVSTLLSEGAIDANDPHKTLAALRVFAAALSSAPEAEPPLPAAARGEGRGPPRAPPSSAGPEDLNLAILPPSFLDEFLERLLGLLTALDSSAGGAGGGEKSGAGGGGSGGGGNTGYGASSDGGGASFLLSSSSVLRPAIELAFARSTRSARARAVAALARFVRDRAMPCVAQEAALLVNAAAWAEPRLAAEVLLPSLLDSLERHLPSSPPSSSKAPSAPPPLSKSAESSLCWQLSLVASCCYRCGFAAASDPRNAARLRAALLAASRAPSRAAVEAASRAIASTLAGLLSCYPLGSQMMPLAAFSTFSTPSQAAALNV